MEQLEHGEQPKQTFGSLEDLDYFTSHEEVAQYQEDDPDDQLPPTDEIEPVETPPEPQEEDFNDLPAKPQAKSSSTVPMHYEPMSFDKYERFINLDEKRLSELLTAIVDRGYTAITEENYSKWKDILGDTTFEDLMKCRSTILPEHIDLINLNLKSKAMLLAQLVTFSEAMKFVVSSNEKQLADLTERHLKAIEEINQKHSKAMDEKTTKTTEDFNQIAEVLEKHRKVLQDLVAQSENIQNNLTNAETKVLTRIEDKVKGYFADNIDTVAEKFASTWARKFARAKYQDIQLKTHIIYTSGMVATALTFFLIGKYIN